MEAYRILFNPLSGSGKGKENAEKLNGILSGAKLTYVDMTSIRSNRAKSWLSAAATEHLTALSTKPIIPTTAPRSIITQPEAEMISCTISATVQQCRYVSTNT